ncbi:peptidyl-tRNA hydrolase [compost metagenome]
MYGHVLSDFSKADREWLDKMIEALAEAAPALASRNDADYANKIGLILKPPAVKEKKPKEKDETDGI